SLYNYSPYCYDDRSIFFLQAEDGIRDRNVTGVQTCALPLSARRACLRLPGLSRWRDAPLCDDLFHTSTAEDSVTPSETPRYAGSHGRHRSGSVAAKAGAKASAGAAATATGAKGVSSRFSRWAGYPRPGRTGIA